MLVKDHQWELVSADGVPLLLFGTADTGIQTTVAPDLGSRSLRGTEFEGVREDGRLFGAEYDDGTDIVFEVNVLSEDWLGQSDRLDELLRVWKDRRHRLPRGAYALLRCRAAGRDRVAYGRPHRIAYGDADLTHEGYTRMVMDFASFDGKFYDLTERTTTVTVVPPSSVGFSTPIVTSGVDPDTVAFQTETLDPATLPGAVTVDGDDTWAWLRIYGPVTNPVVGLGDFEIGLDTTIADGDYVDLDPRPWTRRVVRSDGANLAGALTHATPRMADWLLEPGAYELTYRGTDATGTSSVAVSWREAHHTP